MKSGKQRRNELKARRFERARALEPLDPRDLRVSEGARLPPGVEPADPDKLSHNHTYGVLPSFYVDRAFTCRGCARWRAANAIATRVTS